MGTFSNMLTQVKIRQNIEKFDSVGVVDVVNMHVKVPSYDYWDHET